MTGSTILIVGDNRLDLKFFSEVLAHDGYATATASPALALQEALACRPQLVLINLRPPLTSDLGTVAAFKADPCFRDVPLVAVCGFTDERGKDGVLALGYDDFMPKPVSIVELRAFAARYLRPAGHEIQGAA